MRSLALSLTFRLLSLSRSLSLSLSLFEFEHSAADPKKRRPGCGVAGRVSGTSFAAFAELAALSSEAAANAKKKSGGKQGEGEAVGESTSFASVAAALSTSIAMLSRPQGPLSRSLAFVKDENRNPNQQQQQPKEAIEQLGSRAAIAPHSVAVVLAPLPRSSNSLASSTSSSPEALAAEARTAAAELTGSVPPHCRVVWLDCSSMLPLHVGVGGQGGKAGRAGATAASSSSSPPPRLAALDAALRETERGAAFDVRVTFPGGKRVERKAVPAGELVLTPG